MVAKALAVGEKDWEQEDRLVTWKGRVYIPKDQGLRADIVKLHHDPPAVGHPGRYKTHELITRNYWWPRVLADINRYVEGCKTCQRVKPKRTLATGLLQPNKIPLKP